MFTWNISSKNKFIWLHSPLCASLSFSSSLAVVDRFDLHFVRKLCWFIAYIFIKAVIPFWRSAHWTLTIYTIAHRCCSKEEEEKKQYCNKMLCIVKRKMKIAWNESIPCRYACCGSSFYRVLYDKYYVVFHLTNISAYAHRLFFDYEFQFKWSNASGVESKCDFFLKFQLLRWRTN